MTRQRPHHRRNKYGRSFKAGRGYSISRYTDYPLHRMRRGISMTERRRMRDNLFADLRTGWTRKSDLYEAYALGVITKKEYNLLLHEVR